MSEFIFLIGAGLHVCIKKLATQETLNVVVSGSEEIEFSYLLLAQLLIIQFSFKIHRFRVLAWTQSFPLDGKNGDNDKISLSFAITHYH